MYKFKTTPIGRRPYLKRLNRTLIKQPLFMHAIGFIGYISDEEEARTYLKNNNYDIEDYIVVTRTLGYKEEFGFIKKTIIFPKLLK